MKGIIQGFAFFILMLGISLGLMYYVAYDSIRYQARVNLKQSMSETLMVLSEVPVWERESILGSTLEAMFKARKRNTQTYKVDILGFSPTPLALKVRLEVLAHHITGDTWMGLEETMIEVEP